MPPQLRKKPSAAQCLKPAEPGHGMVYLVHPGALPADVHRGGIAAAMSGGLGLTVLDLGALPEYWEAALTGGRAETTLEDLADRLRGHLENAHEDGPVVLAGWSFGGVVAHAMVELLDPALRPERLVLLDSIAPTEAYKQPDDALRPDLLLDWFAMYLGVKRGRAIPLDYDRLLGCDTESGLALVLEAAIAAGALPADTAPPGLRKLYTTYVDGLLRNNRLTDPYRPRPAVLPLTLISAERGLIPDDPTLGWEPLAAHGLSLRRCPGDHYTMLTRPDATAQIADVLNPAPAGTRS